MKLSVKVIPNSKQAAVEKVGENTYTARVNAPAKEGKANEAVIELLSDHFDIPKSRITILKGHTGRNKIILIQ